MKLILSFFVSLPIVVFFIPTIRIANLPLRLEDIFLIISLLIIINSSLLSSKLINRAFYCTFVLLLIVILTSLIEWSSSDDINFKSLIFGFTFIKYILWSVIVFSFKEKIIDKRDLIIKVVIISFILQLMIAIFQKFNIFGFASGFPYHFVIKYYAIPNIYATSTDLQSLAATHMNFAFRPAGIVGSSTVTGMSLLILGLFIYKETGRYIFRLLTIFSLVLTFAKIAILSFIVIEIIYPLIRGDREKFKMIAFEALAISPVFFYLIIELGVYDNLIRLIDGSDRGVTHRSDVIEYVFNQDILYILFGNYSSLPFSAFDSGVLLTIFRHGLIYFVIQYVVILLLFLAFSRDFNNAFTSLLLIFFADLTFGSVYNPVFSNVILLLFVLLTIIRNERET